MRVIDPELPWGSWLRIEPRREGPVFIDDETGEAWPSLRSALWNGRLGMPNHQNIPPVDVLELLHAVLAASARGVATLHEQSQELFDGSMLFHRTFHLWVQSTGLITPSNDGYNLARITDEGRMVLLLLAATRPYDVRTARPSAVTVAMLGELGLGPEGREVRLQRLESEAKHWDAAFLRRGEAGKPAIILSKRGTGPVPMLQTVWTLSFARIHQRDRFYEWLCHRLDRWQSWSELASEYGSERLTHRLLAVMAASLDDDGIGGTQRPIGLDPPS